MERNVMWNATKGLTFSKSPWDVVPWAFGECKFHQL